MGFSNPLAIQTAKLVAPAILLLSMLPFANLLSAFASSWLAVTLHRRRTGKALTTGSGAMLGWVIGAINFVVSLLIFTIQFALVDKAEFLKVITQFSPQAEPILREPAGMAMFVVVTVIFTFVYSVGTGIAGGALGASLNSKDPRTTT